MGIHRRAGRVFGVALLAAACGCAHRAAAPAAAPAATAVAPSPSPTPVAVPAIASLAMAEPALLALEDRRAFEPATLGAAAGSPDPAARARAALALGRIGDDRAAPSLARLLDDSVPAVRAEAAFAAGILGDPSLTDALVPRLADPDAETAARAAWAIGFLGASGGEAALAAAIPLATTPARRAAAVRGLWRYSTPTAAAAVLPLVASPDEEVRLAALYVLARRPQEASLSVLTAGLADPDPQTAALCARALGLLGKAESLAPLGAAMEGPRVPPTIGATLALAAVLEKNPGAALPAEHRARALALAADADPNLAVPALALLRWQTDDRDAFRRLWAVASAGAGRRRQVALQALMGGLGAGSLELVDRAIASDDPYLRGAAAESLSFLPEAEAAARRARLAGDPEVIVRLKVLEGLRTSEVAAANGPVVDRLLADPNDGVRAAAVEALALAAGPAFRAKLLEMALASYADSSPDVAIAALGAAEKDPEDAESRAVAEALYRSPSTLVSRLARRALVQTFHADAASFPWREYSTGKTLAEYAALLAQARRPWTARVETVRGTIVLRLSGEAAPLTVMNFVDLARRKYFDGAPVHRVVPNFVVQDGDPTGTGNGGPGYEIRDEINTIPYRTGTLGMALAGPDTGGSQWFVTQAPEPHLDGIYTVFGSVVSGLDAALRIEQGDRIVRITVSAEGR